MNDKIIDDLLNKLIPIKLPVDFQLLIADLNTLLLKALHNYETALEINTRAYQLKKHYENKYLLKVADGFEKAINSKLPVSNRNKFAENYAVEELTKLNEAKTLLKMSENLVQKHYERMLLLKKLQGNNQF